MNINEHCSTELNGLYWQYRGSALYEMVNSEK